MQADIHPKLNHIVFVDVSTGEEIVTRSTMASNDTRDVDGVPHFVVRSEISCYSHPFYTGTQKILDSAGRVERFNKRFGAIDFTKATRR